MTLLWVKSLDWVWLLQLIVCICVLVYACVSVHEYVVCVCVCVCMQETRASREYLLVSRSIYAYAFVCTQEIHTSREYLLVSYKNVVSTLMYVDTHLKENATTFSSCIGYCLPRITPCSVHTWKKNMCEGQISFLATIVSFKSLALSCNIHWVYFKATDISTCHGVSSKQMQLFGEIAELETHLWSFSSL